MYVLHINEHKNVLALEKHWTVIENVNIVAYTKAVRGLIHLSGWIGGDKYYVFYIPKCTVCLAITKFCKFKLVEWRGFLNKCKL